MSDTTPLAVRAAAFPSCANYEQLREELTKLPMTWYPDLLRAMAEASLEKGVFHPIMGLSTFVASVEREWKEKHRATCPTCGKGPIVKP